MAWLAPTCILLQRLVFSKIMKGLVTPFLQFSHVEYRVLDDSYAQDRALICAQRFRRCLRSNPEDPKDPYLLHYSVPHYFINVTVTPTTQPGQ